MGAGVAAEVGGMAAVRGTSPMSAIVSVSGWWLSLSFELRFARSESAGFDFGDMAEGLLMGAGPGLFLCLVFLVDDCVCLDPCAVSLGAAPSPSLASSAAAARPVLASVVLLGSLILGVLLFFVSFVLLGCLLPVLLPLLLLLLLSLLLSRSGTEPRGRYCEFNMAVGVHTQTQHAGDRERWTGRACKDVERAACGGVKGPSSVCLLWRGSSRSSFPWKGTRVAAEKEKREILLLVPLGWHEHLNGHDNVRPLVRGETTMGAEGGHQHERSTTRENENENDHTDEQKNKHPSQQYPPTTHTHTHTHTRGSTEQFAIPAPAPDPDGEAWIGAGGSMLQGGHVQRRKDKVRRWQKKKKMAMLCVTAGLQLRIRARCRRPWAHRAAAADGALGAGGPGGRDATADRASRGRAWRRLLALVVVVCVPCPGAWSATRVLGRPGRGGGVVGVVGFSAGAAAAAGRPRCMNGLGGKK